MEENVTDGNITGNITESSWIARASRAGVILGIIHIILFVLIYFISPSKAMGLSYLFLIILINTAYCIYQGVQWRKERGGFINYGEAFKFIFVILAVNGLVYTIFSLLFLLIEPDFPQVMAQGQLDVSTYWAAKFGAPEESLDQIREKFNMEEIASRYNFGGLMQGYLFALIFYAIGTSIFALIVRKRQPEVM